MLTDYLVPLTAALVVLAVLCVLGAILAWRRASAAHPAAEQLAATLDERAITLPGSLSSVRATLAEQGAAAEHALWTLARVDERLAQATRTMAERRQALDALGARLEGARTNVERLKSAARLIMRAIELRRAFLG